MSAKRVLSVGNCMADQWSLSRTLRDSFGAEVVAADTPAQALDKMRQESFALVMVNRVFDRDGSSGLDLIRQLRMQGIGIPAIMVSGNGKQLVDAAAKAGVKAVLRKPLSAEALEQWLEQVFSSC